MYYKCEVSYYIDDINLTVLKYTYKGCLVLFLSKKELYFLKQDSRHTEKTGDNSNILVLNLVILYMSPVIIAMNSS